MFEAARQLGELVAKHRAAERQAAREARNAKRRAAHARRPKLPKPEPLPVSTAEEDWEPFCRCHVVAPCSFCESGGSE